MIQKMSYGLMCSMVCLCMLLIGRRREKRKYFAKLTSVMGLCFRLVHSSFSIFLRQEVSNTWRLLQIKPMSYEQVFINFEHEYNARLQELDDAMRVFETENIVGIYREKNQTERELYNKF